MRYTNTPIIFILFVGIALQACGKSGSATAARPGQNQVDGAGGLDATSNTGTGVSVSQDLQGMNLINLSFEYQNRQAQDDTDQSTLDQWNQLNSKLCERLSKMRNDCGVSLPLMTGSMLGKLGCSVSGNNVTGISILEDKAAHFQARVKGTTPSDKFVFEANGAFVSDTFSADGAWHELTFRRRAGKRLSLVPIPQIRQISGLMIRYPRSDDYATSAPPQAPAPVSTESDTDSGTDTGSNAAVATKPTVAYVSMPDINSLQVEIQVEGQIVPVPGLYPVDGELAGKQYKVDMTFNNPSCLMTEADINLIRQQVNSNQSDAASTKLRQNYAKSLQQTTGTITVPTPQQEKQQKDELIQKIMELRANIAARTKKMLTAQNQNSSITGQLRSDNMIGCYASQPITTLDVTFDGTPIDYKFIGTFDYLFTDLGSGSDKVLTFEFGPNISMQIDGFLGRAHADLNQTAVIGALEYLRISRGGVTFENYQRDTGTVFSSHKVYDVKERNLYKFTSIKVSVNNQPIFSKTLDLTLDRTKMSWTTDFRAGNQLWDKLMQTASCVQLNNYTAPSQPGGGQ